MGKAPVRNITAADRKAAERLKALWLAMPRETRPTQQQLADAYPGDANQSLISQYMNGRAALNYRAVRFFAKALGVPESAIRTDLPEQALNASPGAMPSENYSRPSSQPAGLSAPILHEALTLLQHDIEQAGEFPTLLARTERLADLYRRIEADGGRLSADGYKQLGEEIEQRRGKDERAGAKAAGKRRGRGIHH